MQLSKQQELLINYGLTAKSIIVNADAGTGKSFTLQQLAIQKLLNAPNLSILVTLFNTKNRKEWEENSKKICHYIKASKNVTPTLEAKTYHQLGYRLMKKDEFKNFSQLTDNWEVYKYFEKAEKKIHKQLLHAYITYYEKCKTQAVTTKKDINNLLERFNAAKYLPESQSLDDFAENIVNIYKFAQKHKGGLSTSDMINFDFINKNKRANIKKYDVIFLDEFQDLSLTQINIIKEYCHEKTQLIFVGDGKQQVNLFMGSLLFNPLKETLKNIFDREFKELSLTGSYRNPQATLDVVNKKFGTNTISLSGTQGEYKVNCQLQDLFTYLNKGKEVAVICSQNEPLRALYATLLAKGYNPYYSGFDLDKSTILEYCQQYKSIDNIADLKEAVNRKEKVLKEKNLIKTNNQLKDSKEFKIIAFIRYSIDVFKSLDSYYSFLASETPKEAQRVVLTTVHKCKGLTFDNIFIIEPNLFNITNEMDILTATQLRCSEYVALTRNRNDICIIPENNFTTFETKEE